MARMRQLPHSRGRHPRGSGDHQPRGLQIPPRQVASILGHDPIGSACDPELVKVVIARIWQVVTPQVVDRGPFADGHQRVEKHFLLDSVETRALEQGAPRREIFVLGEQRRTIKGVGALRAEPDEPPRGAAVGRRRAGRRDTGTEHRTERWRAPHS